MNIIKGPTQIYSCVNTYVHCSDIVILKKKKKKVKMSDARTSEALGFGKASKKQQRHTQLKKETENPTTSYDLPSHPRCLPPGSCLSLSSSTWGQSKVVPL